MRHAEPPTTWSSAAAARRREAARAAPSSVLPILIADGYSCPNGAEHEGSDERREPLRDLQKKKKNREKETALPMGATARGAPREAKPNCRRVALEERHRSSC